MHRKVFSAFCFVFLLFISAFAKAYSPADFAPYPMYTSVKISPDGKHLAVAVQQGNKRRLMILELKNFSVVGGVNLGGSAEPGQFFWANNKRLVMQVMQFKHKQEEANYYGELYAVDFDGSNGELIYGYRAQERSTGSRIKKKKAVLGWADIIDILPDDPEHILIASTPMSSSGGKHATVHKLNVNSGVMSKKITRAPVPYTEFITDKDHKLALAVGTDKHDSKKVYRYDREERVWQPVGEQLHGKAFLPFALTESGNSLYVLDDYQQDKLGLFKLDLASSKMSHVYTDENVDITDVVMSTDNKNVYALRVDDGYPSYLMIDKTQPEAQIFKDLLGTFAGDSVTITSHDKKGEKWVVFVASDTSNGDYYLYNKAKNKLMHLFSRNEQLKSSQLSASKPVSFEASDGQKIAGYLTYPKGLKASQNVPLVTLVHGGPHGIRDFWEYDPEVQMLASQGFAVLRLNFRGSGGYGSAFEKAGYQQWGDRMQLDIIEGTEWALTQPNIGDKACIMGTSYGGFSAVQSATLKPELFECVVANAGVYDLPLMFEEGDIPDTKWGESYLANALGQNSEVLKAQSPIHNISKLKAPVFIAHGERDRRVPVVQAENLKDAMDKLNKPYVWFVKPNETHGFYSVSNRAEYYQKVTDFLNQYLK